MDIDLCILTIHSNNVFKGPMVHIASCIGKNYFSKFSSVYKTFM